MQIAIIAVVLTMIATAIGVVLPRKPAIALGTLLITGGAITQITKKE